MNSIFFIRLEILIFIWWINAIILRKDIIYDKNLILSSFIFKINKNFSIIIKLRRYLNNSCLEKLELLDSNKKLHFKKCHFLVKDGNLIKNMIKLEKAAVDAQSVFTSENEADEEGIKKNRKDFQHMFMEYLN